jgi:mevalonate pyrophosphate decarboxylase
MTSEFVRDKAMRVASLADRARDMADEMGRRVRVWSFIPTPIGRGEAAACAARRASLLRRAADLAELHAELSGAIREP